MAIFKENAANLLPVKFLLLLTQISLLVLVLIAKENHIWWPLGEPSYAKKSTQYN